MQSFAKRIRACQGYRFSPADTIGGLRRHAQRGGLCLWQYHTYTYSGLCQVLLSVAVLPSVAKERWGYEVRRVVG